MAKKEASTELLGQNDIDDLLSQIDGDAFSEENNEAEIAASDSGAETNETEPLSVRIYDFTRPEMLSRDDLEDLNRRVKDFLDRAVHKLGMSETDAGKVGVVSVDMLLANELLRSVPEKQGGVCAVWDHDRHRKAEADGGYADMVFLFPGSPDDIAPQGIVVPAPGAGLLQTAARERKAKPVEPQMDVTGFRHVFLPAWGESWADRGFAEPKLLKNIRSSHDLNFWQPEASLICINMDWIHKGNPLRLICAFSWQSLVRLQRGVTNSFNSLQEFPKTLFQAAGGHPLDDYAQLETCYEYSLGRFSWNWADVEALLSGESRELPSLLSGLRRRRSFPLSVPQAPEESSEEENPRWESQPLPLRLLFPAERVTLGRWRHGDFSPAGPLSSQAGNTGWLMMGRAPLFRIEGKQEEGKMILRLREDQGLPLQESADLRRICRLTPVNLSLRIGFGQLQAAERARLYPGTWWPLLSRSEDVVGRLFLDEADQELGFGEVMTIGDSFGLRLTEMKSGRVVEKSPGATGYHFEMGICSLPFEQILSLDEGSLLKTESPATEPGDMVLDSGGRVKGFPLHLERGLGVWLI